MAQLSKKPHIEEVTEEDTEADEQQQGGGAAGLSSLLKDGVTPEMLAGDLPPGLAERLKAAGTDLDEAAAAAMSRQSRGEKKSRKALSKLGLKRVSGVRRMVAIREGKVLFYVSQPDVYRSSASDTYVLFGEPKAGDAVPDIANQFDPQQLFGAEGEGAGGYDAPFAERHLRGATAPRATAASGAAARGKEEEEQEEEEDLEEMGDGGMDPKDIELVVQQADVSRAKAVRALRNNDGDIVNAILELTV